ncbi:hypothetical protein GSI_11191 [Ganoderma sinense ZZ0214-1]|uniref:Uncharacterized protein n=1 Tax=Ganoderma sinense ZZ0214-1 TaxID=1077348 RepID=A0A2G8RYX3_9APHY|nr:hypothetical protein GSI_11191 [Ganoderma sinense ZZ0214-1]
MTTQASWRDHWESVNSSGLHEFRDIYWGSRGRTALKNVLARRPLERFLHFRQTAVQDLFDLSLPDGLFLVREDYLLLSDRIRKARKEKASEMQGCLLLGQQGIGKSHFLLLLLLQCLSREETVLFTSSNGDTYLFDEDGIVRTHTADFSSCTHLPKDFPDSDPSERLWSLVDYSQAKEPTSPSVTYGARQLFFVAVACPDLPHCGDMKERFNVREWWMSQWTENELRALLAALPPGQFPLTQSERYPLSSPDTARSLIRDVGSCLQDILLYLRAPNRYEELVNAALLQYTSVEAIYRLLSGLDLITNPDAHRLVLISRAGPVAPDALDIDDRAVARFKTRAIHSRVLANVMALSLEDTQHLYASFRASGGPGKGPFATASSALLFENMALRYARDERDFQDPRCFAPFRHPYAHMPQEPGHRVHMTRTQTASPAAVRFLYQSDAERGWSTTVAVSDLEPEPPSSAVAWRLSRGAELDRSDSEACYVSQHESEPWSVYPCGARTWPSVAALCAAVGSGSGSGSEELEPGPGRPWTAAVEMEDVDGAFCLASESEHQHRQLFDAYALRVDRHEDEHCIWAIRVATPGWDSVIVDGGRGVESDKGGFADIVRLKEAVREAYGDEERPVQVSYALIVPYGEPMFGVEWSLPARGFEEHPGSDKARSQASNKQETGRAKDQLEAGELPQLLRGLYIL